jgi:acetoin utilization deacetylase AcuC-like enzyme
MNVALVYDDLFLDHYDAYGTHPECPERLVAILEALKKSGVHGRTVPIRPRKATREELERVHNSNYLDGLERIDGDQGNLDPDTYYSPRSVSAALHAAGGTIDLATSVLKEKDGVKRGFSLVRPPGHHAESTRAMGFCLLNNVALSAEAALNAGAKKVAIVDWDVHHGNGTCHSFFGRSDVLFMSVHRGHFFPGTGYAGEIGVDSGKGFTVNAPLMGIGGDADFASVFDQIFIPIITEYDPDLILVSAGFDAHEDDPLGGMGVTDDGYRTLARKLINLAKDCCEGRLAAVLEGGYDLDALGRSVRGVIEEMLLDGKKDDHSVAGQPTASTAQTIDELKHLLRPYWKSL